MIQTYHSIYHLTYRLWSVRTRGLWVFQSVEQCLDSAEPWEALCVKSKRSCLIAAVTVPWCIHQSSAWMNQAMYVMRVLESWIWFFGGKFRSCWTLKSQTRVLMRCFTLLQKGEFHIEENQWAARCSGFHGAFLCAFEGGLPRGAKMVQDKMLQQIDMWYVYGLLQYDLLYIFCSIFLGTDIVLLLLLAEADLFSRPCMELQEYHKDVIRCPDPVPHLSPTATETFQCPPCSHESRSRETYRVIRSRQGREGSLPSLLIRHRCSMLQPSLSPKVVMAGDEEVAKQRVSSRMLCGQLRYLQSRKPKEAVQRIWRLRREWTLASPFRWWIYIDVRST